jgi:catecholate siderophore receptor
MLKNAPAVLFAAVVAASPLVAQDTTAVRDSLRSERRDSAKSLARVVVRAARPARYAPRTTRSATRTDLPLIDVPQAVSVVAAQLLADQSAQSMADVVRYIPGITMGQGEGHRDAPTIRGNSSTADFFVDGVRDDAQYLRDLYNVERVEALKGSNAMVFGRGGGGGVINRVTKDAQWVDRRALTYEGGSYSHRRATVDIGNAVGGSVAGRVNAMLERSGDFRNATSLTREGVNPTASLIAGNTLFRVGYEYFADRRTVNRGIPSFRGRPSNADISTFFGDPDQSHSRVALHSAGATIERGSTDGLFVRNATRFATYDKFYQNIFPGPVNADGSRVALSGYSNDIDRRNLFNQTDVAFDLGRGAVRQLFLVGAELGRQTTDSYRRTAYFAGDATALSAPFDRPTVSAPATFRQSASDADNRATAGISAAFVQDQVELGSHWLAVAGLRLERFEIDFRDNRRNQNLFRADRMLSPRFGLVYKPRADVSIYGNHSVSSLPSAGDQFSSLTVTNSTLEPERFRNREIGAKWDLSSGLAVTGALYQLDRSNSAAPDPLNSSRTVQTGRQRTVGAEAAVNGNIGDRWEIASGYAWQHAKIRSRTNAARAGAVVPLVPWYTLSLWNRYRFSALLSGGVGIIRQDDMYAAIDNSVTLPAFTRLDAALFLSPAKRFRAQVNVENVMGVRYYPTSHGNNNILPGAPRTLRVSLTATP